MTEPTILLAQTPTANPIVQFLPLIAIFLIMYFMLIRPQQRRMKEHKALIAGLKRGDKVVTSGGIIGKITHVGGEESDEVEIEIASGVKVKVVQSTITSVMSKTEPVS